jgi:hypothetical protein
MLTEGSEAHTFLSEIETIDIKLVNDRYLVYSDTGVLLGYTQKGYASGELNCGLEALDVDNDGNAIFRVVIND